MKNLDIVFTKDFSNKKKGDVMNVSQSLKTIFVNELQVAELKTEKTEKPKK